MALGINTINQNIFAKPAETISGAELSKVAQEILSTKASTISSTPSIFSGLNLGRNLDVSLFGSNASSDTNAVKLAATNTAGYDLQLSQKTLSAVNALNSKAASDSVNNIAQFRNGIVHINAEQPDFTGLKNLSALNNPAKVLESMNLSKDRKGSSPFYVPRDTKNKVENGNKKRREKARGPQETSRRKKRSWGIGKPEERD